MAKLAAAFAAALLLLACSPAHALDLTQFLNDPKYAPFLQKALATADCLTDPAVANHQFDLDLCPSALNMLVAVEGGATDYPGLTCEKACAATFYTLSEQCLTELTAQFNQDTSPIGVLGSRFLEMCAEVHNNPDVGGGAAAGAPSPAMGPGMAPAPAPAPMA